MDESKRCPDCGETKPAEMWGKNKRTSNGLAPYCKVCISVRNRAYRLVNIDAIRSRAAELRVLNVDAIRAQDRKRNRSEQRQAWRIDHRAANAEHISSVQRLWRERHPDYQVAWRTGNPDRLAWERNDREVKREQYRAQSRKDRAANPGRFRRAKHKYRAAKASNGHIPYTDEQWQAKFDYWGQRCWICSVDLSDGKYHIDHVKPINKGGMDCLSNLRPACGSCNQSKRDRWPFNPLERSHGHHHEDGDRHRQVA